MLTRRGRPARSECEDQRHPTVPVPALLRRVTPVSMGSAGLKYGPTERWRGTNLGRDFCDLAWAGGPPHRGTLLEAVGEDEALAAPKKYQEVVEEISRGIWLVTRLNVLPERAHPAGSVSAVPMRQWPDGWCEPSLSRTSPPSKSRTCSSSLPAPVSEWARKSGMSSPPLRRLATTGPATVRLTADGGSQGDERVSGSRHYSSHRRRPKWCGTVRVSGRGPGHRAGRAASDGLSPVATATSAGSGWVRRLARAVWLRCGR